MLRFKVAVLVVIFPSRLTEFSKTIEFGFCESVVHVIPVTKL